MKQLLKLVTLGFVALSVVGCATQSSVANTFIKNDKAEGVIYGALLEVKNASEICAGLTVKDERCNNAEQYKSVIVMSKVDFVSGGYGIVAFADKDLNLSKTCSTGSSSCVYLKAKVEKNKLGTVLEVLSKDTCSWSGMPRAGGTVCAGLYDYRKDFTGLTN